MNPSDDTTSGNSERRLEIHFEWARRFVLGLAGEGLREVERLMDEAVEESELETLW